MNSQTQRLSLPGAVGALECALDEPAGPPTGLAVVCHPHPQHGGTMDNKVVQTIARACLQLGWRTLRFNYRGVGASAGAWDEGRGEVDDALAAVAGARALEGSAGLPLALAGFSFGGHVAANAAHRLAEGEKPQRLLLVAPSTRNFVVPPVPEDTVLVHGEADDVVPLQASLDWARPQSLPVVVVPGVGHFFHGQLTLLKNIVLRAWR
jgi:alpha/beta superfamily hydrolase